MHHLESVTDTSRDAGLASRLGTRRQILVLCDDLSPIAGLPTAPPPWGGYRGNYSLPGQNQKIRGYCDDLFHNLSTLLLAKGITQMSSLRPHLLRPPTSATVFALDHYDAIRRLMSSRYTDSLGRRLEASAGRCAKTAAVTKA
jgi:hypothetical protein